MTKGSVDDGVVYHAGFPNAAEDERLGSLNLDSLVVQHRASTFFWRLETEVPELVWPKDSVLVVDKALSPHEDSICVITNYDDFLLSRFHKGQFWRFSGEKVDQPQLWGVVTYCLLKVG